MNLRSLNDVHFRGVPLYSIPYGSRFRYRAGDGVTYSFVKHSEHEFPQHFCLSRPGIIVYSYSVGIPESAGHIVVFVKELDIVQIIEIP
jgi:hypothetical protein